MMDGSGLMAAKSLLIDGDTVERMKMVDIALGDNLDDMSSAIVSYTAPALERIFSEGNGLLAPSGTPALASDEVFTDLEVFSAYASIEAATRHNQSLPHSHSHYQTKTQPPQSEQPFTHRTVASAVDRTLLAGSKQYIAALLRTPLSDVVQLQARQASLDKLQKLYNVHHEATDLLFARISQMERHMLWMYRPVDEELTALHDIAYFRTWVFSRLNGSGPLLTALNLQKIVMSPLVGILSPIVYFMVPYIVLRVRFGVRLPFRTYLWVLWRSFTGASGITLLGGGGGASASGSTSWAKYVSLGFTMLFYFQSLFTSFEISSTLRKICRVLVTRMKFVQSYYAACQRLLQTYWVPDIVHPWFQALTPAIEAKALIPSYDGDDNGLANIGGLANNGSLAGGSLAGPYNNNKFSLFSNFGEQLRAFREFDMQAHAVVANRMYALDAIMSVLRLAREPGFGRVQFAKAAKPSFSAEAMWHPCLDERQVVPNNVAVGGTRSAPGMMLTGPNAGGKSTLLKSMMITVLMAQSLTVVPAKACALTPFTFLNSHINVPDCKGKTSLFEAEMYRAKANIDALRWLKEHEQQSAGAPEFAFIILDEIFSSTNPVEGIAGAYSVAKHMVQSGNCLCVISTHFLYLCKLAKNTGLYENWKMPVRFVSSNTESMASTRDIEYPYKLRRGTCSQYIALELLKQNRFDESVLHDAMAIKESMTRKQQQARGNSHSNSNSHSHSHSHSHSNITSQSENQNQNQNQNEIQSTSQSTSAKPLDPTSTV
jgi:MutS domain V